LRVACSRSIIHYHLWIPKTTDENYYGISVSVDKIFTNDYAYGIMKGNVSGIFQLQYFPNVNTDWTSCLVQEIITINPGSKIGEEVTLNRFMDNSGK
jgi:hypothetical protein